jgi:hypothetical protein
MTRRRSSRLSRLSQKILPRSDKSTRAMDHRLTGEAHSGGRTERSTPFWKQPPRGRPHPRKGLTARSRKTCGGAALTFSSLESSTSEATLIHWCGRLPRTYRSGTNPPTEDLARIPLHKFPRHLTPRYTGRGPAGCGLASAILLRVRVRAGELGSVGRLNHPFDLRNFSHRLRHRHSAARLCSCHLRRHSSPAVRNRAECLGTARPRSWVQLGASGNECRIALHSHSRSPIGGMAARHTRVGETISRSDTSHLALPDLGDRVSC